MSTIVRTYEDGTKEIYIKHEELGHGGFAVVYRVTNQKTNRDYAIKVISREKYEGIKGKKAFEKLKNEIKIQKIVNHPNIVKSYGSFSDDFNYYIILEYCPNKSVKELLRKSPNGYLSENVTRKILRDVVEAVIYLHSNNIIHRDLKLENYMIGSDEKVKIADFGVSVILKDNEKRFSICGTPNYFSPELLQKDGEGHSYKVDIWAIGVSAFTMLTGHPPFEGGRKSVTYENIKNCDYHFPPNILISSTAKDFINTIFQINPNKRPNAIHLSNHKFLTTFDKEPVTLTSQKAKIHDPIQHESNLFMTTKHTMCTNNQLRSNIPSPVRPRIPLPPKDIKNNSILYDYKKINITHDQSYNIPNSAVSRYLISGEDLGYLLANGTVGACFSDHSRIVIDPNEDFIQYYQNYGLNIKIIDLDDYFDKIKEHQKDKLYDKILLVKKFAKTLKKITSLYDLPTVDLSSSSPLVYVKYYKTQNNTIIFKFNDKNIQVDFDDHKKLFILWNTKQMCLVRNIKDNCTLMKLNDVVNMDQKSEEYKKFMTAKVLISQL